MTCSGSGGPYHGGHGASAAGQCEAVNAAKLVEIVGVIVNFWLIATIGIPYLVSSFTDTMRDNIPSPAGIR